MHVYVCACVHVGVCMHVCMCESECMHMCVCACVRVCMCVCVWGGGGGGSIKFALTSFLKNTCMYMYDLVCSHITDIDTCTSSYVTSRCTD